MINLLNSFFNDLLNNPVLLGSIVGTVLVVAVVVIVVVVYNNSASTKAKKARKREAKQAVIDAKARKAAQVASFDDNAFDNRKQPGVDLRRGESNSTNVVDILQRNRKSVDPLEVELDDGTGARTETNSTNVVEILQRKRNTPEYVPDHTPVDARSEANSSSVVGILQRKRSESDFATGTAQTETEVDARAAEKSNSVLDILGHNKK